MTNNGVILERGAGHRCAIFTWRVRVQWLGHCRQQDGTLAWPAGAVPGLTTHPAKIGDSVIVYATGLGAVANPPADGENSLDQLRPNLVTPQVMIGGVSAQVGFAGLSPQFVGVNQINVTVPNVAPGNSVPFQIVLGGITTSDSVTMAVSQ